VVTLGSYKIRALHLIALWAYGVGQPTLSILEANPEFLVVRGSSLLEVVVFVLVVCLAVPLAALALEWLAARISRRIGDIVHVIFVGVLLIPLAARLAFALPTSIPEAIVLAASVSVLGVVSYLRWRPVRLFLAYSIILPVLGAVTFVYDVPLTTDRAEAADVEVTAGPPIVLVIFDEFPVSSLMTRSGEIDSHRYPHFGKLARTATWYVNASAVHEHTTSAVPAILTGRMPRPDQLPVVDDHRESVFTLLANSYEFHSRETVTHVCPTQYCTRRNTPLLRRLQGLFADTGVVYLHDVLPDSMTHVLPSIDQRWGSFLQQGRLRAAQSRAELLDVFDRGLSFPGPEDFERFLDSLRDAPSRPTFHAIHVLQPHAPWRFLPSGHQYGFGETIDGATDREHRWEQDPWLVTQGLQRHLLQVGYTDALVGRLVEQLKKSNLYDRALVIVTADHGTSFAPGGDRRRVDSHNIADIASVPLIVKYPRQRAGKRVTGDVRTIDIVPTIADVVGVPVPWRVDGRSLRHGAPNRPFVVVGRNDGTCVRVRSAKVRRLRASSVRSMVEVFGEGRSSLYRIGRATHLLGREVAPEPAPASEIAAYLENPTWLLNVQKASPYIPSRISGWIDRGELPAGAEIAVAVNGRIAALTQAFRVRGRQRFRALVPPTALREGLNRVDLFSVSSQSRLVWLGSS
jgi:hypothetical protein